MKYKFEYIWLDGIKPHAHIRTKTKIVDIDNYNGELEHVPEWSFDGSSTKQADGNFSDCIIN